MRRFRRRCFLTPRARAIFRLLCSVKWLDLIVDGQYVQLSDFFARWPGRRLTGGQIDIHFT